ncbi:CARDB domain-containing protein [Chloroflexota bacterium]
MPEGSDLKKSVKESVKNLVKEVLSDIVYRIVKAGTKRAINELKQELREKSISVLQGKLETLSERQLDKWSKESTERLTREITREGIQRENLIREIEQGFRQGLKDKLLALTKAPVLKIVVVTTICLIAAGAGAYAAVDYWSEPGNEPGPHDKVLPEVIVRYIPERPEPGQRVTFIADAGDNIGIDWIELLVNGEIVEASGSSPCVFEGGPYDEGSTVRYSAYAYDEAGNRAWSGEQFLYIPVSAMYPDLVIAKARHEWIKPGSGLCVIYYIIQNRGESEAGPSLTNLRYGRQVWEAEVGPLAPGQTSEGEFPPIEMAIEAGFEVELCADGRKMISEDDENNNCFVYKVQGIIQ